MRCLLLDFRRLGIVFLDVLLFVAVRNLDSCVLQILRRRKGNRRHQLHLSVAVFIEERH